MTGKEFLELIGFEVYNMDEEHYSIDINSMSSGKLEKEEMNYIPKNLTPEQMFNRLASKIYDDGKIDGIFQFSQSLSDSLDISRLDGHPAFEKSYGESENPFGRIKF